ncbi:hypothetical protein C0991_009387 [Blastosporella zonata]|nr:hypothetical protein C0991_009387 [Blastosporella zonata]
MHAYVHEWACQLIYNPRLREGLGLTDGEGVERLWSQMRKLIGITRSSHRQRRIWIVDRHVRSIGLEHRAGLGSWIKRRLFKGVDGQGATARQALKECGVSTEDLRTQWADQRQAQLTVRSYAPTRLKKELDAVLTLQGQMEAIDDAIENLRARLTKADAPKNSITLLSSLQRTQEEFKDRGEALYSSLNVHDSFPQLENVDLDFVRILLTARDLKINIRKRAIGSFLEWEKLDQAAGGREQSLGTKLHQATRSAIAKRAPALMNAIRKFNGYCDTLSTMYNNDWAIPLPEPLPVKLAELRASPLLMEDVWISQTSGERPRWLAEPKSKGGLALKQTTYAVGLAAITPLFTATDDSISILLQQQHEELLLLRGTWSNPLATVERFNAHVNSQPITTNPNLTWTPVVIQVLPKDLGCQDDDPSTAPSSLAKNLEVVGNGSAVVDGVINVNNVAFNSESIDAESATVHGEDGEDNTELLDLIFEEQSGKDVSEQKPHSPITLNWTTDETDSKHSGLLDLLHLPTFAITNWNHTERVLYNGEFRVLFEPKAMNIMSNPHSLLNDTCVNSTAHLLHKIFSDRSHFATLTSSRCAVFSTYDLPMICKNTTDSHIWRRTFRTGYWSKDCWIIPIHRPHPALHWVLCWVLPKSREILLFDSFAARGPWEDEIKLHPCQSNGYDCGVWVLATIASVLCGYHVSDLSESDMPTLRRRLLENILALSEFKVQS